MKIQFFKKTPALILSLILILVISLTPKTTYSQESTAFKSAGGPIVSTTQPTMVSGDLWIDSKNNQLYFFDVTDLVLSLIHI